MAEQSSGHRKQIFLFLAAVIIPCLALIVFGLQVARQEKELFEKRAAEERAHRIQEIGQQLLVRLETIKLEETQQAASRPESLSVFSYLNPEVIVIGLLSDGRLLLPWEFSAALLESQKALGFGRFRQEIQDAEAAEFRLKDPARAARLFGSAAGDSGELVQKAHAQLFQARALAKSGQKDAAVSLYLELLLLPSSIMDEMGIPLSLYAAQRLLGFGTNAAEVSDRLCAAVDEKRWSSPVETSMLSSLLEKLSADPSFRAFDDKIKSRQNELRLYRERLEKALNLEREFPGYAFLPNQEGRETGNEPVWVASEDGSLLLSLGAPLAESGRLLIAVGNPDVLASLRRDKGFSAAFPEEFRLTAAADPQGESLGPNFVGLKIALPKAVAGPPSSVWSFHRSFYLLAMALVIVLTLFGAYLLWRDVRRDLKLAEMRSQFVSSVSHELKTPLTSIRMFAETLRLQRSKDPAARDEYLDTIVKESERLSRLLNNVLDFSKIEQGKKVYRPATASLAEVIRETARAMEYPLKQQGFSLNIECQEDLPGIVLDRDGLEQALMNLLSNAMKYSGNSREIGLRLFEKETWAVIEVSDHGVGIDPAEQKRIFDKFYRVASPENDRLPGTGLGLALVSHFVKAHRGRIEVESSPGRGSTFSLYLPMGKES
jgi:nitrogen-specific signal transduction histidine kinase